MRSTNHNIPSTGEGERERERERERVPLSLAIAPLTAPLWPRAYCCAHSQSVSPWPPVLNDFPSSLFFRIKEKALNLSADGGGGRVSRVWRIKGGGKEVRQECLGQTWFEELSLSDGRIMVSWMPSLSRFPVNHSLMWTELQTSGPGGRDRICVGTLC